MGLSECSGQKGNEMTEPKMSGAEFVPMGSAEYPGVLRKLDKRLRVVVNPRGTRYALQYRRMTEAGEIWLGQPVGSLSALVRREASEVDQLAEKVAGLPEYPSEALPQMKAAHDALLAAYRATDNTREDYGRVIARDGNWRLIVEPCGTLYRLQSPSRNGQWRSQKVAAALTVLRDWAEWTFKRPAVKDRIAALFVGLPEKAADGEWPEMVKSPRIAKREFQEVARVRRSFVPGEPGAARRLGEPVEVWRCDPWRLLVAPLDCVGSDEVRFQEQTPDGWQDRVHHQDATVLLSLFHGSGRLKLSEGEAARLRSQILKAHHGRLSSAAIREAL